MLVFFVVCMPGKMPEGDLKPKSFYISLRDCFPKFANGLNIKIDIAQKVYEL